MIIRTSRIVRAAALAVVLALSVGACGAPWAKVSGAVSQSSSPAVAPRVAAGVPAANGAARDDGVVARGESASETSEARNIRLVRNGDEVALQFELRNGGATSISPSGWIDPRQRRLLLFDLPRGTSYQVLTESSNAGFKGTWGRLSGNWMTPVAPDQSITLTAVFAAPPPEATSMLVALGDLLPVQVPITPTGSAVLRSDPILFDHHRDPNAGPLVCAAAHRAGPTQFRLPADVLFAFDSATLSPAAQTALTVLAKQVNGTSGNVAVAGNTDAIGSDAYNQTLSEQRAAAVADALRRTLGGNFTFTSVGFGKTKPVAPNTNLDGSDNPDGRAQNRRVDVNVTTTDPAPQAPPSLTSGAVSSDLSVTVASASRMGGYLMTYLRVSNTGTAPATFPYVNTATANAAKGGLFAGELAVLDTAGTSRNSLCIPGGNPNTYFSYAATMTSYRAVDPGQTLTLWGLTPAPPGDVNTVNIQVGGFGQPVPTRITPGP
ncbi:MAG: OmpA-OmpF porin, family [Pseudonocardiales bacterium]|nr:OmpA-OmpF porin, family [Pseudonocardiales bacterium]